MQFIRQHLPLALFTLLCVPASQAQFTTGSTGSDGAYNPTVSGDFDPVALGLNPSGNNVFNFTTINIPANVTIKLRASKLRNAAVTWLATGNVSIVGTLDLSGASGPAINTDNTTQFAGNVGLPEPGPGGYTGGLGSRGGVAPQPGAGPGGGPAGLQTNSNACTGGSASFIGLGFTRGGYQTGLTYGSYLLVPLYGGSGGGGGWDANTGQSDGGLGGAGGGAIRIASNTQISVAGTINAYGGDYGSVSGSIAGCPGGAGAGGAIHLVAPTIVGNGTLNVNSGNSNALYSIVTNGIVRFGTNNNAFTGNATGGAVVGGLYLPPANSTIATPSLTISKINGVSVPAVATGLVLSPDLTISAAGAVTVNLAGANIPVNTAVTLRITGNTGPDTVITCTSLAGTAAASTSTCSATFPYSVSIASVRATW